MLGLLMFVYGAVFLVRLFIIDLQFDAFGSRTSLTFIAFQGLVVILQYAIALRNTRYFIEFETIVSTTFCQSSVHPRRFSYKM